MNKLSLKVASSFDSATKKMSTILSDRSWRLHPRNFLAAHLNINSYRYKFDEIKELLSDKIVDIFFVAESKLDATFNDNLFIAEGYKLLRRDRDSKMVE
jgi:hypothetical protein